MHRPWSMFNWSRQQAEALYYNWRVLIYGLVADVAAMFRGTVPKCFSQEMCVFAQRRLIFERNGSEMRLLD